MNNQLKLIGAVAVSLMLAACAGNKVQEPEQTPVDNNVQTYTQEDVNAVKEAVKAPEVQISTLYYFDFDTYQLTSAARSELDLVARVMKETGVKARLEGHADERGSREYNLALGEKRAKAVANYLTVQGVSQSQLEVVSYGEEKPAVLGSNEQAWSKNRRVELIKK